MTNSTTFKSWLCKTNFSELGDNPVKATVRLEAARLHAMHYTTIGIREYSQWFMGEANVVSDALSRNDNQSSNKLTHVFCTLPLPFTDSTAFRDSTPAQQNLLVADCVAAEVARESTVQRKTHQDQA